MLQARPAPPGGAPREADGAIEAISWSPAVLVGPDGRAVVAWSEERVDPVLLQTLTSRLLISTAGARGPLGPTELTRLAREVPTVAPRLAALPGGRVLAAWVVREDGRTLLRTAEGP